MDDTGLIGNFRLRPVTAVSQFVVPFAVCVLVLDTVGGAGDLLLGRGDLGGAQRVLMVGERLGECRADLVGPAPIMLDDLVSQLGHEVLRLKSLICSMQPAVGQSLVGNQYVRFLRRFDQCPTRVCGRTITFQHFEASVEGITMPRAAIERPGRHQTLGRFPGAADLAIFADMTKFDHDRLFKRLVVHHRRQRCAADLVATPAA
ncbi:hypothetical protein MESS2_340019 [Mesorhizobium metallidurans STM 2683]|uniref:Uncharacterized protein n=1 Tax=Mesorhizobium metallidurans STM 2683 TaxID=1297569 RepID=M5ERA0_9HYPH|nr:hypothetical protein MESS2_340019 [Mesorhizobium metallidurans STM 2683]